MDANALASLSQKEAHRGRNSVIWLTRAFCRRLPLIVIVLLGASGCGKTVDVREPNGVGSNVIATLQQPTRTTVMPPIQPSRAFDVATSTASSQLTPVLSGNDQLGFSLVTTLGVVGGAMAVSRDGQWLAVDYRPEGGRGNLLGIFDMANGVEKLSLERPVQPVIGFNGIAFSPQGTLVAAGGLEQIAYVWNLQSGGLVAAIDFGDIISDITFSQDGALLIATSAGENAHISYWAVGEWSSTHIVPSSATSLAVSPAGGILATGNIVMGSGGPAVKIFDLSTWQPTGLFGLAAQPNKVYVGMASDVAFSRDGRYLACIVNDEPRLWDLSNNTEVSLERLVLAEPPLQIEFAEEGSLMLLLTSAGVSILDPAEGSVLGTLEKPLAQSMAVDSANDVVAIRSRTSPVEIWHFSR